MALYLQMDGVDDRIVTPTLSYNKVVFDVYVTPPSATVYLLDPTNRTDAGYIRVLASSFANNVGTMTGQAFSTRTTITLTLPAVKTYALSFFGAMAGGSFLAGKLYDVKLYTDSTLVAHYDMTTGTVQDQSGNGKHATLTGGTWLDDGAGGGTGTDGATAFDLKQLLYRDASTLMDSKQAFYSDGAANGDTKQVLFADGAVNFDSIQAIYSDSQAGYDTRLSFYSDASTLFDTLQEFFSDGIVGSTPFDIRMILYADSSAVYDSKQAWYSDGSSASDIAQQFYQSGGTNTDIKLVIYADASTKYDASQTLYSDAFVKADMAHRYYTDGTLDFDMLQAILDDWAQYNEVIRLVLNISRSRTATLDITQRMQNELKL